MDIFIIVYLDNIIIYLKKLNKYRKYVRIILEKLLDKRLRCKLKKYKFYKTKINFLGFRIEVMGIKINLIKTKTVEEWLESKNLNELQKFLRFRNFHQRFISKYLRIILSLIEFTKKISFI